ncbi:uncharacterized protein METZ01_LOCUS447028 [marine metagenome]|uniref:Uncharacterized protein n=1 Tax=marine metagenome TaxID=408172 RepID=A0A382ZF62_9ZZZZ
MAQPKSALRRGFPSGAFAWNYIDTN